jgi:hypothetical protein
MPNDLHVSERYTPRPGSENRWRPAKTRYRYFLGVKVVAGSNPVSPTFVSPTLSARPVSPTN